MLHETHNDCTNNCRKNSKSHYIHWGLDDVLIILHFLVAGLEAWSGNVQRCTEDELEVEHMSEDLLVELGPDEVSFQEEVN
jgi:hypothetical protein